MALHPELILLWLPIISSDARHRQQEVCGVGIRIASCCRSCRRGGLFVLILKYGLIWAESGRIGFIFEYSRGCSRAIVGKITVDE